ncbi:MAG TPA: hypothetical protein VFV38_14265, partial [Ktedonobacteraceae bacterium]|nr:hypothetical protein [Ktedonobacteraceae bacterium]
PAEVGLQLRGSLKIGNVADGRDQQSGSYCSNPGNGGEDLALSRGFNDLDDLRFKLGPVLFEQVQFGNQLRLGQGQSPHTRWFGDPNTLPGQAL